MEVRMPARKFTVEQIIAKLREAERLQGQGLSIGQVCKRLGSPIKRSSGGG
jgi:hypothetical protein